MKRLLSIELYKIWKNRASKLLIITYFIILLFTALVSMLEFNFGGVVFKISDQGVFNFPYIWHFNTYIAALIKIFLAIVIVSMMANEYSFGTLKQNLIDGLSKKEFLFFSLVSTLFVFILTILLGFKYSTQNELNFIVADLAYTFAYFIKILGFFTFCLFITIWIKKSAFAIGFIIVWTIIEKIVYSMLGMFVFSSKEKAYAFVKYFPLESMSNLIKEPFRRMSIIKDLEAAIGGQKEMRNYDVQLISILVVMAWIFIFLFVSYKILEKKDL